MYGSHGQSNAKVSAHTEWSNALNTYRDDKAMPTCRLNYISNHPTTKLAKLHTSKDMIAPTWGKISATVWESSATLCGGYGRRLQRSSISCDAPTYFNNPTVQYNTEVPPPGRKATITRATNRVFVENESAYVLPGGKSILAANMLSKSTRSGFSRKQFSRQFPHGNQTLLEHLEPGQTGRRTPIDWNYSTSSSNNFADSYNPANYNDSARSERPMSQSRNNNNNQQQQQSTRRAQTAPHSRRAFV